MTEKSDSIAPEQESADKGFAFARPPSSFNDPATVVTTVGQAIDLPAVTQPVEALPAPRGSSIVQRLFPPENTAGLPAELISPEGCQLEHFVIEKRIGIGGMGSVFRAFDQRLKRTVALKVLSPGPSNDSAAVRRFQNEAQSAARLDHDNIARVFYVGFDQGMHFIAYEYITGTNIREMIRERGQFPPTEAVNYTLQVATALRHTWAAGVVHRDIKPSNIIVTPRGRAKIVDLGLARKEQSESVGELTVAGTTLGTFDYISPEQAKDPRKVDVRSDIYSLGCTLYHMLAGVPPYPEGTVLQKLLDHQGKNIPDVRIRNPAVSPELSAIVLQMMASDPNDRYAHPDDLIRDLLLLARELGLPANTPEGLVWASRWMQKPRFWERNGAWVASVAALFLIVFVVDRYPVLSRTQNEITTAQNDVTGQPAESPEKSDNGSFPDLSGEPQAGASTVPPGESADPPRDPLRDPALADNPSGKGSNPLPAPTLPGSLSEEFMKSVGGSEEANDFPERLRPLTGDQKTPPDDRSIAKVETEPTNSASLKTDPATGPVTEDDPTTPPIGNVPDTTIVEPKISIIGNVQSFPNLAAAIAAADEKNGSIIELKYDRRLPTESEKPIRIVNKKVTIRAGKKADGTYYRPIIRFENNSSSNQEPSITLTNGSLKLFNIDVLMVAPQYLADGKDARLFSLTGEDELELRGCSVTVQSPGDMETTIVHLEKADPSRMSKMNGQDSEGPTLIRVDISRSVVRGDQSNLFATRHTHPSRFTINNSVIAIDGTVLNVLGDRDAPNANAELEFDLQQVTCFCGNGLVRMDVGENTREIPPVKISATDNIFSTNTTTPLIVSMGTDPLHNFRWSGVTNFYSGFETFWQISVSKPVPLTETLSFEDWKNRWRDSETSPSNNSLLWDDNDWQNKLTSTLLARDLAIDSSPQNPAMGAANDGNDVGAAINDLPIAPDMNSIR